MSGRGARFAVMAATAGLVAAGCSTGVGTLSLPNPSSVTTAAPPASTPSLPAGLASTPEGTVAGVTTTTAPAVGPGPATLNGTVLGPAGPVGGAVVQAERLVGDSVATARTRSAADGSWSIRNVFGGRYRIRAWLSPNLDLTTPQIIFLAASQPQPVTLQLTAFPAPQVTSALNPSDPTQGSPANLVVQVVNPTVGPDGVLTYAPVAGASVTLVEGPAWQVSNGNPLVTDGSGQALFNVQCTTVGVDPLSAQVAGAAPVALQVPPCGAPPYTPPPPPAYQFPGNDTTTTTCPNGSPSPSTSSDPNATTTTLAFGNC